MSFWKIGISFLVLQKTLLQIEAWNFFNEVTANLCNFLEVNFVRDFIVFQRCYSVLIEILAKIVQLNTKNSLEKLFGTFIRKDLPE